MTRYSKQTNMEFMRTVWRSIVRNRIYTKPELPRTILEELKKRHWKNGCYLCSVYHPRLSKPCPDCILQKKLTRKETSDCVEEYFQWRDGYDITGAAWILKVIEDYIEENGPGDLNYETEDCN